MCGCVDVLLACVTEHLEIFVSLKNTWFYECGTSAFLYGHEFLLCSNVWFVFQISLPLCGDYSFPYPVHSICYAHTVHTFIDIVNEQGYSVYLTCRSRVSLTYRSSITTATTLNATSTAYIYIPNRQTCTFHQFYA